MEKWENQVYSQVDLLLASIIESNQIKTSQTEIKLLQRIYELIKRKYPNKSEQNLRNILNKLIKMRLPHPTVILCFPYFKEKLDYIFNEFTPNNSLLMIEASILMLYPNSKIEKNINIGGFFIDYFLPNEKLGFMLKKVNKIGVLKRLNYFQIEKGIRLVFLSEQSIDNHCEIRRQVAYQVHPQIFC